MHWKRYALATIGGALTAVNAWAVSGSGTTAASFLKIGVGPRAVSLAEAFSAVADDPSALYWNPSGLAQLKRPEVMAMHVFWLGDVFFDYLAGTVPVTPAGTLGASLVYVGGGAFDRRETGDGPGSPDRGQFSAADAAGTVGYGVAYSKALDLGAALKFFSESVDARASLGWALDLGALYQTPWDGLRMGGGVQNLGPAVRLDEEYFRLPINLRLGFAYTHFEHWLLTLEYNQQLEQAGKLALGVEYRFEETLALRLGYHYQGQVDENNLYEGYGQTGVAGLSAGVGIHYREFQVEYAFVPYGLLGATHRLALTYRLPAAVSN